MVPIIRIVDNPDLDDDPNKCLRLTDRADAADCAVPRDDVLAADGPDSRPVEWAACGSWLVE